MAKQRPEAGVEYAAAPTAEYQAHGQFEAVRSLAKYLGTTELRAADLLADPAAYAVEIRAHDAVPSHPSGFGIGDDGKLPVRGRDALRQLERKYAPSWMRH